MSLFHSNHLGEKLKVSAVKETGFIVQFLRSQHFCHRSCHIYDGPVLYALLSGDYIRSFVRTDPARNRTPAVQPVINHIVKSDQFPFIFGHVSLLAMLLRLSS
jgi:hypothetical protein